ncbi:MAG: rod shape-determining protein MreD [Chitinophagaceae bacterium]|nr:rod shape-determining protein MreD [Chitinophagaceae bacterium]
MNSIIKHIFRLVIFLFVQVYILSNVPLVHHYITPYLYFLFILWLPFSIRRWHLLIIGFSFGMLTDYFLHTPGLHAAPCALIAYLRPFLLNIFIAKDSTEQSFTEPSVRSMGWGPYSFYIGILTFLHHAYLVFIEWMQFGTFGYFILKVLATTVLSLVMIFITEMLFSRKTKSRLT